MFCALLLFLEVLALGVVYLGGKEDQVVIFAIPVGLKAADTAGCRDGAALPLVTLRARDGSSLSGKCEP